MAGVAGFEPANTGVMVLHIGAAPIKPTEDSTSPVPYHLATPQY